MHALFEAVIIFILFSVNRQLTQLQTIVPVHLLEALGAHVVHDAVELKIVPKVVAPGLFDLLLFIFEFFLQWGGQRALLLGFAFDCQKIAKNKQ